MTETTQTCPHCAVPINCDDAFCGECGAQLTKTRAPSSESEKAEQTDKYYAALMLKGFSRYFLQQDDFSAIAEAKKMFGQAIECSPERPEAHLGLGLCHYICGDDEAALPYIEQGLKNGFGVDERYESIRFEYVPDGGDPDDPDVFEMQLETVIMHRAAIHLNLGDLDMATRDMDGVFENIPEEYDAEKYAIRAEISLNSNSLDDARHYIEEALSRDQESAYSHTVNGQLFLEEGNAHAAIDALSRALFIEPMEPEALLIRAKAYFNLSKTNEMMSDIKELRHIINEGYSDCNLEGELDELVRESKKLHS